MKIKFTNSLLWFAVLFPALISSCTDDCTQTQTYKTAVSIQIGQESLSSNIKLLAAQELKNPGKIYTYGNYLFINETKKGIHIIDNSNPESPKNLSFIQIPGVIDIAIKDQSLYADNYTDLVVLDISNISAIKEKSRLKNMFTNGLVDGLSWYFDPYSKIITDYEYKMVTRTTKTNCGNNQGIWPVNRGGNLDYVAYNSSGGTSGTVATTSGQGGSMARFTIVDDYLYTATQQDLIVFNIKNSEKPDSINKIKLGWGVETIYPYQDKLFIGSNTGMYIYDNANREKPERLSVFQHVRACDPVVVEGNRAYVTLREGWCGAAPNRLDVLDVTNLTNPFILKSYDMQNPHGLSILANTLTVCEGTFGLKSYNAANPMDLKLTQHIKDINAYDVIQLSTNHLLMIGKDGLYQYNNSDKSNLILLSKITINRN
jgi:hypothetical protein